MLLQIETPIPVLSLAKPHHSCDKRQVDIGDKGNKDPIRPKGPEKAGKSAVRQRPAESQTLSVWCTSSVNTMKRFLTILSLVVIFVATWIHTAFSSSSIAKDASDTAKTIILFVRRNMNISPLITTHYAL